MYLKNNKNAAAYIRLSNDEEIQQTSIENQMEIITEYCNQNNLNLVNVYSDDGYTGTTFNRPAFKKMLEDLDAGIINCVITKDVSRLGRNLLGVGRYVDEYFVNNNIRYISIMEGYDSASNRDEETMGLRMFLNDYYAKECSKQALQRYKRDAQVKNLTRLGCYGYMKDSKGNLFIDEETAPIVKLIFEEYHNGKSPKEIAEELCKRNILTPLAYKQQRGFYKNKKINNIYGWTQDTIIDILKNGQYTGDAYNLIEARRKCATSHKRKPPVIVKNTHPAIISHELFESVKSRRMSRKKRGNGSSMQMNKFSKLLYCPVCKKAFAASIRKGRKSFTYVDKTCHISFSNKLITDMLYRLALKHLNEFKAEPKKFERKVIESKVDLKRHKRMMDEISSERNKIDEKIQELFEEYTDERITKEDYQDKLEILNDDLNYLQKEENKLKLSKFKEDKASKEASDFLMEIFNMNIKHLSQVELIKQVVNKVILTRVNGEIIIHNIEYKF